MGVGGQGAWTAMSLEDDILSMEDGAAKRVAAARVEAKHILGSIEERRKKLREEIGSRVEREKAAIREDGARRVEAARAEIRLEGERALAAVEKAGGEKAVRCARTVVGELLRDIEQGKAD